MFNSPLVRVMVWLILMATAAARLDAAAPGPPLEIYRPTVTLAPIYFPHPAATPLLKYNHDVDIVKFRGRFLAAWNANAKPAEGVPGQYNFLSVSDDFQTWSTPVRLFYKEGGCENPVETDNQWQPSFINHRDEILYCAWCDYNARRTFVASSRDGLRWRNHEVPSTPPGLEGQVVGFPTNHGLITSRGTLLIPCSLPPTPKFIVGDTRFAAMLRSEDGGTSWQWSQPLEAAPWSQQGENPKEFGTDRITIWEPMPFQQADGRIGLLVRNSTAQDKPEIPEKSHRMLLCATSNDDGRTWTKARTVEVDTICSRSFAVGGLGARDGLLMVMNDNYVQVPERISRDRYFLSLYLAPVSDPDLLLPGPLVQPQGGTAFYPNGFVDGGKLYLACTSQGIHSALLQPLPDFSRPFLLPREGRPGLRIDGRTAYLGQRQSSLGLVLTEALTCQARLRLTFDVDVHQYLGRDFPILTLGGKTRQGTVIRAIYSEDRKSDVFQVRTLGNQWANIGPFRMKSWNHFEIEIGRESFSVAVNGSRPLTVSRALLRKICFGGLYEKPEWPMGMSRASDIRLNLDSIVME